MNVTSHDSGTYICYLENGLGEGLEVQTVLEVREERPATVVYAPYNVVLVQGRSGKVFFNILKNSLIFFYGNECSLMKRERCLACVNARTTI